MDRKTDGNFKYYFQINVFDDIIFQIHVKPVYFFNLTVVMIQTKTNLHYIINIYP